ncbi:MAG TPA: RNA polymerase sigma factor FliA [Steroidobacteraceae bacterium]|nr:RNA polymerase sigma factor FliA [Steroidobacteraceae bacterium]
MSPVGAYQTVAAARPQAADELVMRHADLVKRIAYHLAGRLPSSVDVEDLIQAGMIGLLEAAAHYVADRGASFETYAGIRIRGAMIDALRQLDWAPRSVHRRAREVADAMRSVERERGRAASDAEIAAAMNIPLEEYHGIVQDAAACQISSLEEVAGVADIPGAECDPLLEAERGDLRTSVAAAIAALPERERLVMSLYYDDELNLKEIGAVLGVSESRACQLHGQALLRLRGRLAAAHGGA